MSEPPVNLTAAGRAPLFRVTVGVGRPHAATGNDPAVPTVNVVVFALVKVGGTTNRKFPLGSPVLAVFPCPQASMTTPPGMWIDTVPLPVIPDTATS